MKMIRNKNHSGARKLRRQLVTRGVNLVAPIITEPIANQKTGKFGYATQDRQMMVYKRKGK